MKAKIEKAIELERGKFYIIKVGKDTCMEEMRRMKDCFETNAIDGMIVNGEIEVIIPKKEE